METCLGIYDCVSLISGYWAICLRRSTERVRTVSPSRLTSIGAGDGFVFGVGCWLLLLVGVFLLWFFLSCCVSLLASAPYATSYISYDVSSHSEWALDFLLGCSTTGVAFLIPS